MADMPTVAVHDLVVHPRDGDVIAATHGRSVWILDDITPLQQLTSDVLRSRLHLFDNRVGTLWKGISRGATRGHRLFLGRNPLTIQQVPPGNSPDQLENSVAVHFYLGDGMSGPGSVEITDLSGENVFTAEVPATEGINRYYWGMRFNPTDAQRRAVESRRERQRARSGGQPPDFTAQRFRVQGTEATPGTYRVRISVGGETRSGTLTIREDPGFERLGSERR